MYNRFVLFFPSGLDKILLYHKLEYTFESETINVHTHNNNNNILQNIIFYVNKHWCIYRAHLYDIFLYLSGESVSASIFRRCM